MKQKTKKVILNSATTIVVPPTAYSDISFFLYKILYFDK